MSMPKAANSTASKRYSLENITDGGQYIAYFAVDYIDVEFLVAGHGRDGRPLLRDGSCELHVLQQGLHGRVRHEVPAQYLRLDTKLFFRGGYAEVVNMDDDVMALLQKSISAKLCPTVLGQACMDIVANPPKPGEPSYDSWLQEKEVRLVTKACRNNPSIQGNLASLARRAELVATTLNTIPGRQHCRLTICMELVELTNSIRCQDPK